MASLPVYGPVTLQAPAQLVGEGDISLFPLPQPAKRCLAHGKTQGDLAGVMPEVVHAAASLLPACDQTTADHQDRVAIIACAIAREMGWNEDQIESVRVASALHDVGKFMVSQEILTKPGRLTTEEFALVKLHPEAGYLILKDISFPWPIPEAVRQHHERMDGSGYPRGLKGHEILPLARIVAIADVLDAMTSARSYRPALALPVVLLALEKQAETLLDPEMVKPCVYLFREKQCRLPC